MKQFMLLVRNEDADFSKYSPKDFGALMQNFAAWTQKIMKEGKFLAGEKLTRDLGKSLKVKNGEIVTDGPYADSKDAVGGFYVIKAKDLNEALEIGRGCPCLSYGGSLEVREVEEMGK